MLAVEEVVRLLLEQIKHKETAGMAEMAAPEPYLQLVDHR
jgi:hypothetical protein